MHAALDDERMTMLRKHGKKVDRLAANGSRGMLADAGTTSLAVRSQRVGALAIGAAGLGALAIGAMGLGALAIGALAIGRARLHRLEIDELVVHRLHVANAPGSEAEASRQNPSTKASNS